MSIRGLLCPSVCSGSWLACSSQISGKVIALLPMGGG